MVFMLQENLQINIQSEEADRHHAESQDDPGVQANILLSL